MEKTEQVREGILEFAMFLFFTFFFYKFDEYAGSSIVVAVGFALLITEVTMMRRYVFGVRR